MLLMKLPYEPSALEPEISEKTVAVHYGKHHAGYVQKTNELIAGTELQDKSLDEIILTAAADEMYDMLFNNAAQVWNHNFFWQSLTPNEKEQRPSPKMMQKLIEDFGSFELFKNQFKKAGLDRFGSGWVWLIQSENGELQIKTTGNADTPLVHGWIPLLCVDVWEHAYYLDYQNKRAAFLDKVVDKLLNWVFAERNLK